MHKILNSLFVKWLKSITFLISVCQRSFLCKDRETVCGASVGNRLIEMNDNCHTKKWHSVISIADKTSGLRNINVTSPGSHLIHKITNDVIKYPLNIGSRHAVDVWIETSCCYDGVEITAQDLRGHSTKCVAGINPNKASCITLSNTILKLLCIYITVYLKNMV